MHHLRSPPRAWLCAVAAVQSDIDTATHGNWNVEDLRLLGLVCSNSMMFLETSAKTAANVAAVFDAIAQKLAGAGAPPSGPSIPALQNTLPPISTRPAPKTQSEPSPCNKHVRGSAAAPASAAAPEKVQQQQQQSQLKPSPPSLSSNQSAASLASDGTSEPLPASSGASVLDTVPSASKGAEGTAAASHAEESGPVPNERPQAVQAGDAASPPTQAVRAGGAPSPATLAEAQKHADEATDPVQPSPVTTATTTATARPAAQQPDASESAEQDLEAGSTAGAAAQPAIAPDTSRDVSVSKVADADAAQAAQAATSPAEAEVPGAVRQQKVADVANTEAADAGDSSLLPSRPHEKAQSLEASQASSEEPGNQDMPSDAAPATKSDLDTPNVQFQPTTEPAEATIGSPGESEGETAKASEAKGRRCGKKANK